MIQINPLLAVLTVEAVVVLSLLLLALLFISARRKIKAKNAAGALILNVNEGEAARTEELGNRIAEASGMDPGKLDTVLADIADKERTLYRQFIKLFLNRDTALLAEIDQSVKSISEPYCALLEESRPDVVESDPADQQEGEWLKTENHRLQQEIEHLSNQLYTSVTAMDEVSIEYTKIFEGTKSEEELELSRQRMLGIYKNVEENLNKITEEEPKTESLIFEV